MNVSLPLLALIVSSVALNAAAQIFLRLGMRSGLVFEGRGLIDIVLDIAMRPAIFAGIACYGVSLLTWLVVLSRVEASFAYPFLGLGFVFVTLAAWFLLGEVPSSRRLVATAVIAGGVILLARS